MKEMLIQLKIEQIRNCIGKDHFLWTDRSKNIDAVNRLGLSIPSVKEIIYNLKVEEYYSGPENDHNGSEGTIWKFFHPVTNEVIYIKLKLFTVGSNQYVKVVSFHGEAENE